MDNTNCYTIKPHYNVPWVVQPCNLMQHVSQVLKTKIRSSIIFFKVSLKLQPDLLILYQNLTKHISIFKFYCNIKSQFEFFFFIDYYSLKFNLSVFEYEMYIILSISAHNFSLYCFSNYNEDMYFQQGLLLSNSYEISPFRFSDNEKLNICPYQNHVQAS